MVRVESEVKALVVESERSNLGGKKQRQELLFKYSLKM